MKSLAFVLVSAFISQTGFASSDVPTSLPYAMYHSDECQYISMLNAKAAIEAEGGHLGDNSSFTFTPTPSKDGGVYIYEAYIQRVSSYKVAVFVKGPTCVIAETSLVQF